MVVTVRFSDGDEETFLIGRQGAKIGLMAFGKDQGLEGEARSVRRQRHECLVLEDEAITSLLFLFQDRAVDTHPVLAEVTLRSVELFGDPLGHHRQRDQLRVGVRERCPGGPAVVAKQQRVLKSGVAP